MSPPYGQHLAPRAPFPGAGGGCRRPFCSSPCEQGALSCLCLWGLIGDPTQNVPFSPQRTFLGLPWASKTMSDKPVPGIWGCPTRASRSPQFCHPLGPWGSAFLLRGQDGDRQRCWQGGTGVRESGAPGMGPKFGVCACTCVCLRALVQPHPGPGSHPTPVIFVTEPLGPSPGPHQSPEHPPGSAGTRAAGLVCLLWRSPRAPSAPSAPSMPSAPSSSPALAGHRAFSALTRGWASRGTCGAVPRGWGLLPVPPVPPPGAPSSPGR